MAEAFRWADATIVLPLDFTRLIWASVLGLDAGDAGGRGADSSELSLRAHGLCPLFPPMAQE